MFREPKKVTNIESKSYATKVRKILQMTAFCTPNFVSPYSLKLMTGINKLIERCLLRRDVSSYFPVWKCRNYEPRCCLTELRKIIQHVPIYCRVPRKLHMFSMERSFRSFDNSNPKTWHVLRHSYMS